MKKYWLRYTGSACFRETSKSSQNMRCPKLASACGDVLQWSRRMNLGLSKPGFDYEITTLS